MNDTKSFIYIKQMYMKGFFSLEDRCKEKILSEDTGILLSRHTGKVS